MFTSTTKSTGIQIKEDYIYIVSIQTSIHSLWFNCPMSTLEIQLKIPPPVQSSSEFHSGSRLMCTGEFVYGQEHKDSVFNQSYTHQEMTTHGVPVIGRVIF